MANWNTYQKRSLLHLAIGLILVMALNFIAGKQFYRYDLTKEKRYTLSSSTKEILRTLDRPIEVEVFLEGDDLPAGIKKLRNSTRELLNEFRALSGGMLSYKFIDIYDMDDETESQDLQQYLIEEGLYPTNLEVRQDAGMSKKLIFPGALFSNGERDLAVTILENQMSFTTQDILNNSYNFLEYKLANAIKKLALDRPYRMVVLEGHGELQNNRVSDLLQALLLQEFQVQRLNLDEKRLLDSGADIVVIAKPQGAFSEEEKFEIDQFIMQGGKALWMIDKAVGDMDSFRIAPQYLAVDRQLNLDDMLFRYGVRINSDLVQDIYCNPIPVTENVNGEDQTQLYPWIFHPVIRSGGNHAITKNMDPVMLKFASSIDTIKVEGIRKTVILQTSEYTRTSSTPVPLDLGIARLEPLPEYFDKYYLPLGVLLEGEFRSLYQNRTPAAGKQLLEDAGMELRTVSPPTRQIVISDGDIGANDLDQSGMPLPLGYYKYTRETFANRDFLLNCIEYLLDEQDLISSRNKETSMQLLDDQAVNDKAGLWQFLNLGFPLAFMLLVGGFIRLRRQRKYARTV